ncbi:hypothetical protein LIS04_175 [Listeria phage LIS04]|nr:hypothetical protein LIS04_175 [Listeria phage LIS04]
MLQFKHNFSVYSGDNYTMSLVAETEAGVVDLTDCSIKWRLDPQGNPAFYRGATSLITKSTESGGVTIGDPTKGEFSIKLEPEDTVSILRGQYPHFAQVVSATGEITTISYGIIQII